ncbi:hypothetical protein SAMN02745136_00388 [Anaerocolumna jejuensis DSM 15929]|uniref:Uncharacterized protein n=1 Tax=Anaerocolumna jejuensis DSM 15929 TaxID=1121322 RepID=A0A1M6KB93_9FIRM|nr:hypothetical protein [Anaerocolumna jejuensis]SHJ56167.1 hypothetical protein SAMN02745136_00388 [Anaerocolumna jejuensis DSM 15929]
MRKKMQFSTNAGNLTIQATTANSIGFSYSYYYGSGTTELANTEGVISFTATKKHASDTICSAFGEYDDVHSSIGDFSVSYPWGISVGTSVSRDRYTIQDKLDIR